MSEFDGGVACDHYDRANECASCHVELEPLDIAASKKFFGRQTKSFFCCDCIAEYLEITREELMRKIDAFKSQGCTLFG